MQLNPAAMNVSSSSNERLSSAVQPNTFPPKHKGATFSPDRPSMRSSIVIFSTDRCIMIPKSQSNPKQLVPDDETLGVKIAGCHDRTEECRRPRNPRAYARHAN